MGKIITTLSQNGKTPTERFWEVRDRIVKEGRILVDCFDNHARSKLFQSLVSMIHCDVVGWEDLTGFSDELQQSLRRATGDDAPGTPVFLEL